MTDLPVFEKYKADPYLIAAMKLQKEGKEKAVVALAELTAMPDEKNGMSVILLSRMLFKSKPKGEFRCPLIGLPVFISPTKSDEWPLEPIELVDGVPFLVVQGYLIGGEMESAVHYLEYCIKSCDWNTESFKPKTAEEKPNALAKLIASPRWEKPLTEEGKKVLSAQIE